MHYFQKDNRLFFGLPDGFHKTVADANAAHFRSIGDEYAADDRFVFYKGERIERADPKSFVLLNKVFSKDASNIYHYGSLLTENAPGIEIDVETFEALNEFYSRDKNHIYCTYYGYDCYETFKISGADLPSFRVTAFCFAKDIHGVYLFASIDERLDADSFMLLHPHLAKDKNNVYALQFGGKHTDCVYISVVTSADPATFEVLDENAAKDGYRTYSLNYEVTNEPEYLFFEIKPEDTNNI